MASYRRRRPRRPVSCGIAGAVFSSVVLVAASGARADGDPVKGLDLLTANCARCHSVAKSGPSPNPQAPEFRTLHLKYPVDELAESMAEGISTGHPAMPEFQLEPESIGDVLAYLKTLER
jgi:cytochrome c